MASRGLNLQAGIRITAWWPKALDPQFAANNRIRAGLAGTNNPIELGKRPLPTNANSLVLKRP